MRVCVIGAGVSGLPAIKACLEEGLEVRCYERTAQIGGLWNYRPDQPNIGATVMASTVVNTSKEMAAFSDFPPPADWPNFMHHTLVQKYLVMYAQHFDLVRHIEFNQEVTKVEPKGPMRWQITLASGQLEDFSAVMICTGHHSEPYIPRLPGIDQFKGRVMYAKQYRDYRGMEGKRVFMLGIGNSALDIAVELAKVAKQVTISTRRGTWIFNRVIQRGLPFDVVFQSRFYDWLMAILPWSIANDFHEWRIQQRMDHDLYGLRPGHRFFQQHPAVNDFLANLLASGQITIADDIETIEDSAIVTKDGRRFETDILLLCTGYSFGFPFLASADLIPVEDNQVDLYKHVFPPHPDARGLAVIGLVQPIGSVAPISEMQARWAAAVFSGRLRLPDEEEMRADIGQKRRQMRRQYFQSAKHTVQVRFIGYMDEVAELLGCRPKLGKLFRDSPRFGLRLFLGPNVPYVYRLQGPNCWSGARQAVEGVPKRVKFPLKQRRSLHSRRHEDCSRRKLTRRGLLDGLFDYATTKCLALYLTLSFALGAWLFGGGGGAGNLVLFSLYNLMLAFVTLLAFLFHFDVVWL